MDSLRSSRQTVRTIAVVTLYGSQFDDGRRSSKYPCNKTTTYMITLASTYISVGVSLSRYANRCCTRCNTVWKTINTRRFVQTRQTTFVILATFRIVVGNMFRMHFGELFDRFDYIPKKSVCIMILIIVSSLLESTGLTHFLGRKVCMASSTIPIA
jgi:hypothetical protein